MAEFTKTQSDSAAEAEEAGDQHPFFRYYAQLTHQQNMLQDTVRTGTYRKAVVANAIDFKDKVVMDVGTGSGILAIFAAQAGAKLVHAVEASDAAEHATRLIESNGLSSAIKVIKRKVEDLALHELQGERVDLIISEPMGFLLVHERMLESYILAREKFLKPGGKMFPSTGTMFFLPYSDWSLFNEQTSKANFWDNKSFHGVDLRCLQPNAVAENFAQAVVGCFDKSIVISDTEKPATHTIRFETDTLESLRTIVVDYEFEVNTTSIMHGFACWFDVDFIGSNATVTLSTGPNKPTTHWYQCRLMLANPIAVNKTQIIYGQIEMRANSKYSYDINLSVKLRGTDISTTSHIRLQDQIYHYLQSPSSAGDHGAGYENWGGGLETS